MILEGIDRHDLNFHFSHTSCFCFKKNHALEPGLGGEIQIQRKSKRKRKQKRKRGNLRGGREAPDVDCFIRCVYDFVFRFSFSFTLNLNLQNRFLPDLLDPTALSRAHFRDPTGSQ